MTYIVVGLGNPDEEYQGTRHNTGRAALEIFRRTRKFPEWENEKKLKADISTDALQKEKVTLVRPNTYMNKSGLSVKPLISSPKKAEKLIVLYDDIDLPIGSLKISFDRGSGGHKGIESVARSVGTKAFIRIRIGITPVTAGGKLKKPHGETAVVDFILGKFKKGEADALEPVYKKAAQAIEMIVTEGRQKAMGQFN